MIHCLKLFPNETTIAKDKNTIISEQYDEIVFPHPTPAMQQALHASSGPANSTVSTARNCMLQRRVFTESASTQPPPPHPAT